MLAKSSHRYLSRVVGLVRLDTTGRFENLPKSLNLVPMVSQWIWLGLRYRSFTLPSSANPQIRAGGLVGETKQEYFECMGSYARQFIAEFVVVTVDAKYSETSVLDQLRKAGLQFPLVAKPELGWCGYGVRLLDSAKELAAYVQAYPQNKRFLLQRFLSEEGEAGLFYLRDPVTDESELLGILLRSYPQVVGDGHSSIKQLIDQQPRLHRLLESNLHQPGFDLAEVLKADEARRLSLIGSTRVGGLYCDGSRHATASLLAKVDAIARDMGALHVARFDVRFNSIADLEEGAFTIMEVNGAGSEAVHAWDPSYTIPEVYRMVFAKQRKLFAIANEMRKQGHRPVSLLELTRLYVAQLRLMKRYPRSN